MFNIAGLVSGYGQSKVIHGVDLAVSAGEIVAVMGRNGMGKTTLFKTMMGMLPTMQGSISLDGKALERLESHQRVRSGVAYVPQGRMIFPTLTVEENIRTGMRGRALRDTIPEDIYALFPVLHDMRGRRGGDLSGGSNSSLPLPAPWSPTRACCCWTNPPRAYSRPSSRTSPAACWRFARCAIWPSWCPSKS
ncbi:LIV-I protein F [Achromobacter denitrificans]|nr:LIV-I protein F [Achromobacter denitrificans]